MLNGYEIIIFIRFSICNISDINYALRFCPVLYVCVYVCGEGGWTSNGRSLCSFAVSALSTAINKRFVVGLLALFLFLFGMFDALIIT